MVGMQTVLGSFFMSVCKYWLAHMEFFFLGIEPGKLNRKCHSCHRAKSGYLWGVGKSSSTRLFIIILKLHLQPPSVCAGVSQTQTVVSLQRPILRNKNESDARQSPTDLRSTLLIWSSDRWKWPNSLEKTWLRKKSAAHTGKATTISLIFIWFDGQKAFLFYKDDPIESQGHDTGVLKTGWLVLKWGHAHKDKTSL